MRNREVKKQWLDVREVAALEGVGPRAVQLAAKKKGYRTRQVPARARGGKKLQIHISSLGSPQGPPTLRFTQEIFPPPQTHPPFDLSENALLDSKISLKVEIAKEALNPPPGFTLIQNQKAVAVKRGRSLRTVQNYCHVYKRYGPEGFARRRRDRGEPRSWDRAAIDFFVGLCLKRSHAKLNKEALYEILCVEAARRGWQVGSYSSAIWWYNRRVTPQLKALQKGGVRALDNLLPPVVRDYSDLAPFEILVGDQHRFDFWVVDDETGEVFRPEGYFWQDLRTRCFYGGAVARKYDAQLMGLALRMGMRVFGPFSNIYTDHGRPEESKYIVGILKEMRALGLEAAQTEDLLITPDEEDPEEIHCIATMPGTHTKAIVRNAKAKMIEGSFKEKERILRNVLKVPGHVKDITASQEEQWETQKEIERLAAQGKLLTFREFVLAVLKAMDYYNSKKPHRGILREWIWRPKPKTATPLDCLGQCYQTGEWQPTRISDQSIDLVFLHRTTRTVDRGRVLLAQQHYEAATESGARDLAVLTGKRVSIRHDHPMDPSYILVFHGDDFICECHPTEFSSMKDKKLASRKIEQKRALRRQFLDQYRELTSKLPDFIQYSEVPKAERAAAIVTKKRRRQLLEERERLRPKTQEELDAAMEAYERYEQEAKDRRPIFQRDSDRYYWLLCRQVEGKEIEKEDLAFLDQFEAALDGDAALYWRGIKEGIGFIPALEEKL